MSKQMCMAQDKDGVFHLVYRMRHPCGLEFGVFSEEYDTIATSTLPCPECGKPICDSVRLEDESEEEDEVGCYE